MELLTAIHTRHSIPRVRPDPVPQALVERLLAAAVQAPNHHHNRPWRFVVLSGAARERLGEAMARGQSLRVPASTPAPGAKPSAAPTAQAPQGTPAPAADRTPGRSLTPVR